MAKFAVYFVPQGRFYDLGSSILGSPQMGVGIIAGGAIGAAAIRVMEDLR